MKQELATVKKEEYHVDYLGLLFYGVLVVVFLASLILFLSGGDAWLPSILFAAVGALLASISVILVIALWGWVYYGTGTLIAHIKERKTR